MLFRKKITPSCSYCTHGTSLDDGQYLCAKKGTVTDTEKCFSFRYDPVKRIPVKMKALDFTKYDQENYSLEEFSKE